jgi:hypothetical protein
MALNRVEKERIADSRMKIRSVTKSLAHIDPAKINGMEAIQECLDDAEDKFAEALASDLPRGPK